MKWAVAALVLAVLPARAEIAIQNVTSPGGITAWLVEDHNIPFTALEIRFKGGTSLDLPGSRGAVNLMAATLEEGAGALDAQGFAEARDALAAGFGFSAGQDSISVSAQFLTENRDAAIELLRSALIEPRFDEDAVERVKGQILAGLASDAQDPGVLATLRFDGMAFAGHPYGSAGEGTPDSVAALTRADVLDAHKATMTRDRVYVAAAGDISAAELGPVLDRLLGGLPAVGRQMPAVAGWHLGGGVTVVDYPSPQSVILFGQEGLRLDDPDFFAAFILNEVLGGERFSARLMTELREKRGLTYGVSSFLAPMDFAQAFMGQMATANATVAESIALIREEWQRMATEGITAEELAATKTYMTGSYPLRFDGNGEIADILVGLQMDGLPIDYPATRNARVEAVTLDDVKRVAARLFQPDKLHFVVVGQPEGVMTAGQQGSEEAPAP
ncbi:MAG: insulinase family protein [Rhodobacter sp.]|nr:insulinase family protein [Rhodobacter sp.]MCA3520694.1 insulinase family protein [Rhodobacter sp.]MCA3522530.1 insulinase family protein [Rhodobacter sp.]MCA3529394.1 insulinase family protein [Rhodobacter sp.]MCA3530933.1 insulinase family protein [Rhodobacter sp.]